MKKEPITAFRGFSFQYFSQSEPTLHDINLEINPGEKIMIAGPSGSGKSTLGHCLNGLIPFAYKGEISGSLQVGGTETRDMDIFTLSKTLGTVLQDADGQFVGLTVGEDIAFSMENDRIPQSEMKERVRKVAKMVDMDRWLTNSPYELSGGQKQRTELAGVMIDDVDVLLFDEPLANLDPATGRQAIEIIDDIHRESGKTIIIIEHRLEDVLHRPIDRIIVLDEGRIAADMNPHELISSAILKETGIREPLYVTALKFAGVKVTPEMKPGHITTLSINDDEKEAVKLWYQSVEPDFPPISNDNVLELEGISFSYDEGVEVLHDVSFGIRQGEMLSLVGMNGAGKSTIAKLMCGFEKESKGRILYMGDDIADESIKERAERIGYVMQNPNQMLSQPMIFDEVALGLKLRNLPEEEIDIRVRKALEICGLLPFIKWPVSALSYGQKKRVTIAAILALDPKLIILDEPTAGQDYRHYTEIMEFLRTINHSGVTVLMITHDMHLMLEYTARSLVVTDGRLICDQPASVVLTTQEVIESANLKETSLFTLAQMVGIDDETSFVQRFIDYERQVEKK
ncbi:MAG TPA: ABC transporter ATP-binding protein [Clostridia bacterium]|nr:ABC transporter ATP-binding protein [Clostridia bacterium]